MSAAAGAVGQIVCQLAKREGLKVLASAGDDQKVKFLREELGVDVAWNYKTESTEEKLKANPFDIFYDNGELAERSLLDRRGWYAFKLTNILSGSIFSRW